MEKTIKYDGHVFCIGTTRRYYTATIKQKNVGLHRYICEKFHGPIPEGWHVHHIDGNCFNNTPENLVAIAPKAHLKLHPTSQETLKKWAAAGRESAKEWHRSTEGIDWHKKHYKEVKDKMHEKVERLCANCGQAILTRLKNENCFCRNACKTAWRKKSGLDDIEKSCLTCGTKFIAHKYLGAEYCSRACRPKTGPKPKKKD